MPINQPTHFSFRIEPLLVKEFSKIAPLVIQPYNANYHTPYSEMPIEILMPEQQDANQDAPSGSQIGGKREDFNATLTAGKGSTIYEIFVSIRKVVAVVF